MIRNDGDKIQCPACQTAQPGKEEEVKKLDSAATNSSFKFGTSVGGGGFNLSSVASTASSSPASGFKFGVSPAVPPTTAASTPTSGFTFGSAPTTSASTPTSGFVFGKTDAAAIKPATSGFLFGKAPEPEKTSTSIFNFASKPAAEPEKSGFSFANFGSTPVASSEKKPEKTSDTPKASPFASFSFGLKAEETSEANDKGVDLSASKNLASFADLASASTGFGFGNQNSSFAFSGAGAPVFGQSLAKKEVTKTAEGHDDDDGHVEENEHDPHFEPIIPLPELVQVTTGEEDEVELFVNKGKVYR
jgi:E3 SUMO-protein ligase RanBP2